MEKDKIFKLLLLLKNDSKNLYERITLRREEYMHTFASRRTRSHFPEIFFTRYQDFKIEDLQELSQEIIIALDAFYKEVGNLSWYLNHTEDMPSKVEDKLSQVLPHLAKLYETLEIFLTAEQGQ